MHLSRSLSQGASLLAAVPDSPAASCQGEHGSILWMPKFQPLSSGVQAQGFHYSLLSLLSQEGTVFRQPTSQWQ